MGIERKQTMFYTIRGEVDGFEDTSYERPVKGSKTGEKETIQKFRLSLLVPGTTELVSVDLSADSRTWVVVTADTMRHLKGETDGRAWSMISFNASTTPVEMSAQDLGAMQKARREAKKARKAAAKAQKEKATKKEAA
jgi:hypothetical protein